MAKSVKKDPLPGQWWPNPRQPQDLSGLVLILQHVEMPLGRRWI